MTYLDPFSAAGTGGPSSSPSAGNLPGIMPMLQWAFGAGMKAAPKAQPTPAPDPLAQAQQAAAAAMQAAPAAPAPAAPSNQGPALPPNAMGGLSGSLGQPNVPLPQPRPAAAGAPMNIAPPPSVGVPPQTGPAAAAQPSSAAAPGLISRFVSALNNAGSSFQPKQSQGMDIGSLWSKLFGPSSGGPQYAMSPYGAAGPGMFGGGTSSNGAVY